MWGVGPHPVAIRGHCWLCTQKSLLARGTMWNTRDRTRFILDLLCTRQCPTAMLSLQLQPQGVLFIITLQFARDYSEIISPTYFLCFQIFYHVVSIQVTIHSRLMFERKKENFVLGFSDRRILWLSEIIEVLLNPNSLKFEQAKYTIYEGGLVPFHIIVTWEKSEYKTRNSFPRCELPKS